MENHIKLEIEAIAEKEKKSKAFRIYELLPSIEAALANGVKHKAIFDALNRKGLELGYKSYETYLFRARAKAKKKFKAGSKSAPVISAGNRQVDSNGDISSEAGNKDSGKFTYDPTAPVANW